MAGGKWEPGKSGNPRGVGRSTHLARLAVREHARKFTIEAIDTLREIMASGANENARVRAAEAILDRALGRPTENIEIDGSDGKRVGVVVQFVRPNDAKKHG